MDWKALGLTFIAIFLAEIGDKTQLAAISLVVRYRQPVMVFVGTVAALAAVTLIGVLFGEAAVKIIPVAYLRRLAASLFIGVGLLIFAGKL